MAFTLLGADAPPLTITGFHADAIERRLQFAPYPAAEAYAVLTATNPAGGYTADPAFALTPATNYTTNGSVIVTNITYLSLRRLLRFFRHARSLTYETPSLNGRTVAADVSLL